MQTKRRTKIIATLGPATDKPNMLEKILDLGVNLVRLNFSHGKTSDHQARVLAVREYSKKKQREIGIIADLQGPKIRVARFQQGKIFLQQGALFNLDAKQDGESGDINSVGIDYKSLPQDVKADDTLLLDDGRIVLKVIKIVDTVIHCQVITGGELSNNKGINRLGGGLSARALTPKDEADLVTACELEVDYIALSFPRCAKDVEQAKSLVTAAGGKAGIIAKIERSEAIEKETLDQIIIASQGIMVARGDLGVEIGDSALPSVQKHIIHRCRSLDRPVITATQMMESMIHNSIPTRAEVFDVANAILDGTDAVMLSAETASGEHPDLVVAAMARICLGAERDLNTQVSKHRVECQFQRADEAVAMATMYTANHYDVKAIITLTESGSTPLWMSRIRSSIPIYALSRSISTQRKMTLYRSVYALPANIDQQKDLYQEMIKAILHQDLISRGDWVIITHGDIFEAGYTNTMKLLQVE